MADPMSGRRFTFRHLVEVAVAVAALASLLGYAVGKASAAPPSGHQPVEAPVQPSQQVAPATVDGRSGVPQVGQPDAGSRTPAAPTASLIPPACSPSPCPTLQPTPRPTAKPTVKPPAARPASTGTRGTASWLCHPPKWPRCTRGYPPSSLVAAAGPGLRHGHWRGRYVTVWNGPRHIRVQLVDYCACPDKLIDLYWSAFRRLADPSVGLLRRVVVR